MYYIYENFIISDDIDVSREMQIYRSIEQRDAATDPFFSKPGSGQGLRSIKRPRCNSPARFTRTTWSSLKRGHSSCILIPYLTREESIRRGLIIGASVRAPSDTVINEKTIFCRVCTVVFPRVTVPTGRPGEFSRNGWRCRLFAC